MKTTKSMKEKNFVSFMLFMVKKFIVPTLCVGMHTVTLPRHEDAEHGNEETLTDNA